MSKEYSPFTPGIPVPIEFFVGREREITGIVESIRKSLAMSNLERVFIVGERGIGKSSVCSYALTIAEEKYDALGIHVFLGGVSSLEELVRRIFERLLQNSRDKNWFEGVRAFLGSHVKEVGLFGISLEFDASQQDLAQAVNDFAPTLRNLLKRIIPSKKGIVLVLDDLNGLATSERFANWLKSLVDEIATSREPLPLTLILVGLPDRRHQLIEIQPSLDRVFDLVEIKRFSEAETREFFRKTFQKVNVSVDEEAYKILWSHSGGYPVFLHEIGDAVFKSDSDGAIDRGDALHGIIRAAEVIGAKYLEPRVFAAIRSQNYRGILKKLTSRPFENHFNKRDLRERLTNEESKALDIFLQKMKKMGVIQQDGDAGPGNYAFTNELYAVFFGLQSLEEGPSR